MKKVFKWGSLTLAVLFVLAQAVRPAMTNPPVDESRTMQATMRVPAEVGAVLERSCNDCHSSKTDWPWYSKVTPVNWYLANHVREGRRELSFSEWGTYSPKKAARKLQEICEQVEHGEMPIKSYLLIHPSAKLSDAERKLLCDWANQAKASVTAGQPSDGQH